MEHHMLPIIKGYSPKLNLLETEIAIKEVKDYFEAALSGALKLTRVSAPIFVKGGTGINDNLNGVERPVSFDAKNVPDCTIEVVQSLAKWKRMALGRYKFKPGRGLYTDMNAIRRDEEPDFLHSLYVDQWDWEKIITKEERTEETLKKAVRKIYKVFKATESYLYMKYSFLEPVLPEDIYFITTEELLKKYPELEPKERENCIAKEYGAVFIMKIGKVLSNGERHDGRAPDYDDWELNGDIIFWNPITEGAFEVSSMGIRVDEDSLLKQLEEADCMDRLQLPYHKAVIGKELPYTIGGGIGQSRICMFFLRKAHIGEVQAGLWPEEVIEACADRGIVLL